MIGLRSQESKQHDTEVSAFQVVILLLSLYVIAALFIDTFVALPEEVTACLQTFDTIICFVFILDFGLNLYRAPNKLAFLKWGWIDLVASIPNIDILRWGRMVRVLKIIRLLRGIRSIKKIFQLLFRLRSGNGFVSVGMVSFLLIVFSSLAILICETEPESNIKTGPDAIWWSVSTITTVGYGDRFPVTPEGRVIAMALMFSGVGLFGTLSAFLGVYFLGRNDDESSEVKELSKQIEALSRKIDVLQSARQTPQATFPTDELVEAKKWDP